MEYLEGLCSNPGLLIELLETRLSVVVTTSLGAKSGILVDAAHLKVKRNKGGIGNVFEDGQQLRLVVGLVYIHDCGARMADAPIDVVVDRLKGGKEEEMVESSDHGKYSKS